MLSHFITDFFEYVYEQYLIHVNSVSTYLYHFNPFYTYSISICPGHPRRHRDALQNVNENLVLFVFGVILSWSNLWCTWHMDMAQLLVLRLDLMEAREAVLWKIVKAYSERGETFSLSTWRLLFDSMYWSH